MAKTLQFRRYDSANVANTTGAIGELIMDTSKNIITLHDGVTAGGWSTTPLAYAQSAFAKANSALPNTGGTVNGNLVVTGKINVSSNLIVGSSIVSTPGSGNNIILNPDGFADVIITPSTELYVQSSNNAVNAYTGAVVISGGLGVAKDAYIAGNLTVLGTTTYENTNVTNVSITTIDTVNIANTTASISTTTGALIVAGGAGISGNLNATSITTNNLTTTNTTTSNLTATNTTTSNLIVSNTTTTSNLTATNITTNNLTTKNTTTSNLIVSNTTTTSNLIVSNTTTTSNLTATNTTTSNLIVSNTTTTSNLTATNTTTSNLTATNITTNNLTTTNTTTSNLTATNITTNNLTTTNTTTSNLIINGVTSTNGTANIIGTLNVSGNVSMNSQVVITNTSFSATQSAVVIAGTPTVALPIQDGYMLHISGKQNVSTRIISDSFGANANTYVVYAGRASRGNVSNPTAVQSGDILSRFSGNGYGTTKYQTFGTGRIDFVATENYTDSNTGSQIQFWTCPVGTNTLTQISTFSGTSVIFTGTVQPQKGFIYTPIIYPGAQTAITIDFSNNSLIRAQTATALTVTLSNLLAGKEVVAWITNTAGTSQTFTHGLSAINSTINATTYSIPSTSTILVRYMSIDGNTQNTFVAITHA